jgi:BMFP domain-containing protein YqiC
LLKELTNHREELAALKAKVHNLEEQNQKLRAALDAALRVGSTAPKQNAADGSAAQDGRR